MEHVQDYTHQPNAAQLTQRILQKQEFLKRKILDIHWQSQSPDLNPVEQNWMLVDLLTGMQRKNK